MFFRALQLSRQVPAGLWLGRVGFYRASAWSGAGVRHCSVQLWLSHLNSSPQGLLDEGLQVFLEIRCAWHHRLIDEYRGMIMSAELFSLTLSVYWPHVQACNEIPEAAI